MNSRVKENRYRSATAATCVVMLLWQIPLAVGQEVRPQGRSDSASPSRALGAQYNAGVAKIDFGTSTPADALRIFGKPLEYRPFNSQRGKLSPDNLPDN